MFSLGQQGWRGLNPTRIRNPYLVTPAAQTPVALNMTQVGAFDPKSDCSEVAGDIFAPNGFIAYDWEIRSEMGKRSLPTDLRSICREAKPGPAAAVRQVFAIIGVSLNDVAKAMSKIAKGPWRNLTPPTTAPQVALAEIRRTPAVPRRQRRRAQPTV